MNFEHDLRGKLVCHLGDYWVIMGVDEEMEQLTIKEMDSGLVETVDLNDVTF